MILPILTIAPSPKRGRGVFATERILMNTTIEIAPVIVLSKEERHIVEQTLLYDYIFEWGEDQKLAAVALGYVSIYNHAVHPNCSYDMNEEDQTISIITLKDIEIGDELFINYNAETEEASPVWFEQH
ncbi:MAG: SET domain-containing protein [Bacteroidetes bacterium]|nr:SET domain-containing protein [Bacteroidota bacterium]